MGKHLSDEQIMKMYRMIMTGKYSGGQIAVKIGSTSQTVCKYINALKNGCDVPRVTEARKNEETILHMIEDGMNKKTIMKQMGCSKEYIEEVICLAENEIEYKGSSLSAAKYKLLKEKWKFERYPKNQFSKDGYRIVRKGQKGELKTPYRPDGIFR